MITFDPITPAPLATRIARVVLPLLTCFGYLAFRAYPAAAGRIPLGEAAVMGVVLMALAMITCVALGDLIYTLTSRARRRPTTEELEITAVHTPIADVDTVVARSCAEEIARLDALTAPRDGWQDTGWTTEGVVMRENVADRWTWLHDWTKDAGIIHGTLPPVRPRALLEDTQPYDLLTHEFQPQHHTPPRGFQVTHAELDAADAQWRAAVGLAGLTGRHHRDED